MKFYILLFLFISSFVNSFAQKNYNGEILDKNTLKPIEFVNVYNSKNYTLTNEDGKFDFTSKKDSITFSFLGYKTLKKTISELPENGIIYLDTETFELDEIILTNEKSTFKKMVKTIKSYTPESYNEEFFLRTVLKRNDTLLKIQDINGVVNRKVLFSTTENPIRKKNYIVYVSDMRKAGFKEENIYFRFSNFNELLTQFVNVNISLDNVLVNKKQLKDTNLVLLEIEPKSEEDTFKKGHYIIDAKDNSLHNVFWICEMQGEFEKNGSLKYRTIMNELNVNFYKSEENNQYRIKNAKKNYTVECYYKDNKKIIYDITYIYKTKEFNQNIITGNKVSTNKDIFKLKHPYNKNYWDNNPHLKLTDEMQHFLDDLHKSDKKIITNFKN